MAGHLFSASSYLDDHLPVEARLPGGEGWCSTVLGFGIQEPWLEVYFGVDVIAYIISIFGNVTEYRVQFTTSTDGELRFLMDPATTEPKVRDLWYVTSDDSIPRIAVHCCREIREHRQYHSWHCSCG